LKVLLVNNLKAGRGDSRLYDYVRELNLQGAEVMLRSIGDGRSLEHALRDAEDFDRVVTAGGDGTASAASYILRDSGIPLLPYPAGTANLLAMNLGIPLDPVRCADTTLGGKLARVDLGELNYRREHRPPGGIERRSSVRAQPRTRMGFAIMAGAGFDATIMEGAQGLKGQIGAGAYLVAAIQNIEPQMAAITLDLDGKTVETEGSAVLLVNFARIQFDLTVTHDSDAQDGLLEVVVIKAKHVTELLPMVMAALLDRIITYPDRSQAITVVPEPPNGSSTVSRLLLLLRIARSTNSTGLVVGWRSLTCGFLMNHTSPWSRSRQSRSSPPASPRSVR